MLKELEFECVPISLLEQVLSFLNVRAWSLLTAIFYGVCILFTVLQDVREDLRCSMARDVVTIKNESLDPHRMDLSSNAKGEKFLIQQPKDTCLDFQKKVTLSKHEKNETSVSSFFGNKEIYEQLVGMYNFMKLIRGMKRTQIVVLFYCLLILNSYKQKHITYLLCYRHHPALDNNILPF